MAYCFAVDHCHILAAYFFDSWVYNARIQKKIAPVSVPYAVRDIGPGIQITSDMVSTKKVPGGIVSKNTIMNTKDVIGKYVSNKAVIPKNSIFYTTTVVNWEDLPSSLYEDIPVGNTIVALPVTMDTTYGNSIYPGNYIDLYFVSNKKTSDGDKLMLGKFIESIKVLAVTSSDGKYLKQKRIQELHHIKYLASHEIYTYY